MTDLTMFSSKWARTVLSSVFILFMLAAAHLLMVVINRAELAWGGPVLHEGVPARLMTDRPLDEELEIVLSRTTLEANRTPVERLLAQYRHGETITLRAMPVTTFIVGAALGLTALGMALLWLTMRLKSDATQSIVGIFAGNLIWTGAVEYGLTIAARSLGIAKAIAVVDGQVVATFGEYVLLKHSWGALFLVMAYLLFLESSRCSLFLWWRERVPTMRGALVTGRIDNFGPRSAFQYASTVWAFYVLLLWAYDEKVFGVHGIFTSLLLTTTIAGSIYLVYRLHQMTGWGPSVRYAVAAMIVVWTPIEIAGKWNLFKEPWLLLHPVTMSIFFGGLAVGTWSLWKAQHRGPVQQRPEPLPGKA